MVNIRLWLFWIKMLIKLHQFVKCMNNKRQPNLITFWMPNCHLICLQHILIKLVVQQFYLKKMLLYYVMDVVLDIINLLLQWVNNLIMIQLKDLMKHGKILIHQYSQILIIQHGDLQIINIHVGIIILIMVKLISVFHNFHFLVK
jgi:hypothetical protein